MALLCVALLYVVLGMSGYKIVIYVSRWLFCMLLFCLLCYGNEWLLCLQMALCMLTKVVSITGS